MNRILVIEDEPKMLRNLLTILKLEGYDAIGAENGLAGIEAAVTNLPDLVICDVMMPELDGYQVIEVIRSNPLTAQLPFIFLTARGERQDIRNGMNLGADDYLCKPCPTEELLGAVQARLRRHKQAAGQSQPAPVARSFPDFGSAHPLETLGLTPREAEVLLWIAQGKANAEIAIILGASEKTVKNHVGSILEKLGVENRTAAARLAIEALSEASSPSPAHTPAQPQPSAQPPAVPGSLTAP